MKLKIRFLLIALIMFSNSYAVNKWTSNYKGWQYVLYNDTLEYTHATFAAYDTANVKFKLNVSGEWEILGYDKVGKIAFYMDSSGNFNLGAAASTEPHIMSVFDGGADNEPGFLNLYDDGGGTNFLWMDSGNILSGAISSPADDDAGYKIMDFDNGTIGATTQAGTFSTVTAATSVTTPSLLSAADLSVTPTGDDVLIDGGLTVGSTTQAGDNNLRVEGTSALVGDVTITGDIAVNGGDITSTVDIDIEPAGMDINIGLNTDQYKPSISLLGDADSDGSATTTENFKIALTQNATPTSATWSFTSTQGAGYAFDKPITFDAIGGTGPPYGAAIGGIGYRITGETFADPAFVFRGNGYVFENETPAWMMVISDLGKVAIGLSSGDANPTPAAKFQVIDTGNNITGVNASTSTVFQRTGTATTSNFVSIYAGNTGYSGLSFGDTDSQFAGWINYDHSVNSMTLYTGATARMLITSQGLVGIGTISPQHRLSVVGATPILNMVDSDINIIRTSAAQASDSASFKVDASTAFPTVTLSGGDGDQYTISGNTSDQALFAGALQYVFDAPVRTSTAKWIREYHASANKISPGGSGATLTALNAVLSYLLDATNEYLYCTSDIHNDWIGNSDPTCYVTGYLTNAETAGDSIHGEVRFDYGTAGDAANAYKTQTVSVDYLLPAATQYYTVTIPFPLNYDLVDNVLVAEDIISIRFRLDNVTATKATTGFNVTSIDFEYDCDQPQIEK